MTRKEKAQLQCDYKCACHKYLKAFCDMYGFEYDPNSWVADEEGTIAMVGDYYFNMCDIKLCVDSDIEWKDVSEWLDYNDDAGLLGLDYVNLKSWLRGYHGTPKSVRDHLKALHKNIDEIVEEEHKKHKEGGF